METDLFSRIADELAGCIDKLGNGEFYPRFFQMMKRLAQIDQYMVFELSPNGEYATCRLAHNPERPELGLELASLYLEGAYLEDPLLQELKQELLNRQENSPCTLLEKRTLPAIYRRRFFNVPNFDAKFAFVVVDKESQHLFYINFYSKESGTFSNTCYNDLRRASSVLGALLLRHFRGERKKRGVIRSLLAAGLSEREAQICGLLLQGHTAKSISQSLEVSESTVVTYKKRAFGKLRIRRKSELVRFV